MSIITISAIFAFMAAITFIVFCADMSVYSNPGKFCWFSFLCSLGLAIWLIIANQKSWILHNKSDIKISTNTPDGVQTVGYEMFDRKYKIVNLNKLFGRSLSDSMKIRVTQFKPGPYSGIYFLPHTQYILISSDNEIIDIRTSDDESREKQ